MKLSEKIYLAMLMERMYPSWYGYKHKPPCDTTGVPDDLVDAYNLSDVSLKDGRAYDIVTANIVADIIIKMSPEIGAFVKDGGIVITSGVIREREAEVDAAMISGGFEKIDVKYDGGWCAGVFKKV